MNSLLSMSFRVSASTLRASPFRTFLSTLGIIIGVASLVAVLSLGDGMQQFVRRQVSETTDLLAIGVNPLTSRTVDGASVPLDSVVQWGPTDALELASELGAGHVAGLTMPVTVLAHTPHGARALRLAGTMASMFETLGIEVVAGRGFSNTDTASHVILLSPAAARAVASPGRPSLRVGDSVTLNRVTLTYIGTLKRPPGDTNLTAVVPIGVARDMAPARTLWAPSLTARAARIEDVPAVRAGVERWLARRYGPKWK